MVTSVKNSIQTDSRENKECKKLRNIHLHAPRSRLCTTSAKCGLSPFPDFSFLCFGFLSCVPPRQTNTVQGCITEAPNTYSFSREETFAFPIVPLNELSWVHLCMRANRCGEKDGRWDRTGACVSVRFGLD